MAPGGQCSAAPFFYLINKPWALIESWGGWAANPLITMRFFSVLAGVLLLGTIFYEWSFVPLAAVVAVAAVFRDEVFLNHSIEARPYIVWCLLTFWFTLAVRRLIADPTQRRAFYSGMLWAALMAFTASGSLFLFAGIGAWVLFFRREQTPLYLKLISPAIAITAYYLYVGPPTCVNHADSANGMFSLTKNIARGDYHLIRAVSKLIIAPRILADLPLNLAFLLLPVLFWKQPLRWREERKLLLGVICAYLLALALATAAVIATNYYFVPRMFIFLLVARIFLVATTVSVVYRIAAEIGRKYVYGLIVLAGIYAAASLWQAAHTYPVNAVFQSGPSQPAP